MRAPEIAPRGERLERRTRSLAALIVAIGALARLPLVFAPITYSGDVWRQADTASIAHNFFVGGFHIFSPQINWGGAGPGYVEAEFQLFPWITAHLYQVFGEDVRVGRAVSWFVGVLAIAVFARLARRTLPWRSALLAVLVFAFSPLALRYATAFMPESTVLFFYVATLERFEQWTRSHRSRDLALAATAMSLALLVKPTSAHLAVILVALLVAKRGWRSLLDWRLGLAGALALVAPALWFIRARNLFHTYGNSFGLLSGGDSKFGNIRTPLTWSFYQGIGRWEIGSVFGWVLVVPFLAGLYLVIKVRRPEYLVPAVVTLIIYFAIVAKYSATDAGPQYHLYAVPYAAVGVALGLELGMYGIARLRRPWVRIIPLAIVAIAAVAAPASAHTWRGVRDGTSDGRLRCAAAVAHVVPEGERIIVKSQFSSKNGDGSDQNYQDPVIFFHSGRYGWSLPDDRFTPEELAKDRAAGARWFVIADRERIDDTPSVKGWLADNTASVGSAGLGGTTDGSACDIYRLKIPR